MDMLTHRLENKTGHTYLRQVNPDTSQVHTEWGHHAANTAHHAATAHCQAPEGERSHGQYH